MRDDKESSNGKCGVITRTGSPHPCGMPAGWGTPSKTGPCKKHGGLLPGPRKAAIKAEALAYAQEHYKTQNLGPADAMLACLRDAAGMVEFYKEATATLDFDELVDEKGRPHPFPMLQMEATDRKARYAKMALDANIAERLVRLAEQSAEVLVPALEAVFAELELSHRQRAIAVKAFTSKLAQLEAGHPDVEGDVAA